MRLAVALTFALLVSSCHSIPEIEARPAMWRVRHAGSTVWLLGTIHVLPAKVKWETLAIRRAINTSDALVMELPDDPAATSRAFDQISGAVGRPPIAERIAAATRPALTTALKAGAIDMTQVDGKKSWAAALIIAGAAAAQQGISRENGIEAALSARFAARHRPSSGLETPAAQFAIFDALPELAQRVLLARAIADAAHGSADYHATLHSWARGDAARMAATLDPDFRTAPELQQRLVFDRNRRWTAAIAARMTRPGTVLMAVGAGHLVGPESLIAMLEARGLKVERIE